MQYGNYVKVVNNDLNLRVNDKTLELIGYAYGSDKVFTDELLRVIDIRDYNDEEYIVVDNTSSEFNEVYLIKEEALEEVTIEHTVSELETLLGISSIVVDTGEGSEGLIKYPTKASLKNKICTLKNGANYLGTKTALVKPNYEWSIDTYDTKLISKENPSLDIMKVYAMSEDPKQIYTLEPNVEDLVWERPTILTLDEISDKLGYKVKLKEEQ